ncbi:hypothetical protein H2200_001349 [Cladophialophora chaetospira]|uniref:N-acetyltransferase domain-containing protein n=1 Tax=Cladophialophora chaetospira TaxID=386627 RepID=A0AA38XKQ7_9EURO|nr:hypothetical protein H2200_001349 [Cladophialophora chaetospira]
MPDTTTISRLADGKVEMITERLLLRAASEDDAPGVYEAWSDPEVMRYCTLPHENLSTTQTWLRDKMLSSPANGVTDFIVTLRSEPNHAIGIVGINSLDSREIGLIFSRRFWGTGIAQEALDCVLGYLFEEREMDVVIAEVEPKNERCLRLLERRGFVVGGFKERVWEVGGVWWDAVHLTSTRESWEKRQVQLALQRGLEQSI